MTTAVAADRQTDNVSWQNLRGPIQCRGIVKPVVPHHRMMKQWGKVTEQQPPMTCLYKSQNLAWYILTDFTNMTICDFIVSGVHYLGNHPHEHQTQNNINLQPHCISRPLCQKTVHGTPTATFFYSFFGWLPPVAQQQTHLSLSAITQDATPYPTLHKASQHSIPVDTPGCVCSQ